MAATIEAARATGISSHQTFNAGVREFLCGLIPGFYEYDAARNLIARTGGNLEEQPNSPLIQTARKDFAVISSELQNRFDNSTKHIRVIYRNSALITLALASLTNTDLRTTLALATGISFADSLAGHVIGRVRMRLYCEAIEEMAEDTTILASSPLSENPNSPAWLHGTLLKIQRNHGVRLLPQA